MALKNTVLPIPLKSIDSASFTGSYQLLSAAGGIPQPCFMVMMSNSSNVPVTISYDGTTDADYLLPSTDRVFNFQTNSGPSNFAAYLAKGTKVYVKGAAGTGLFYMSAWYQPRLSIGS